MKRKIKPILLLFFLLFFFMGKLFSQVELEDVVYLKNGSIIRGKIIEKTENERVKIEISGHSQFVFQWIEIQEIKQEKKVEEFVNYSPTGFLLQCNVSLIAGNYNSEKQRNQGTEILFGYQFHERISFNAGFGFLLMDEAYTPIVVKTDYQFLSKRFSPIASFQFGKIFTVNNESSSYDYVPQGGWQISSMLGMRRNTGRKSSISFECGYMYQEMNYERKGWNSWDGTYYQKRKYNRFVMRIGFQFF